MFNFFSINNYYLLIIIALWDMVWKGMALWKAARNNQQKWFIAILIINSIGVLPILYLRFFSKSIKDSKITKKI